MTLALEATAMRFSVTIYGTNTNQTYVIEAPTYEIAVKAAIANWSRHDSHGLITKVTVSL